MVKTSRNSLPWLLLVPSASNSASALACRPRLASSDATVGLSEAGAYRAPISGGAPGVTSEFALDEGEKVGVGLTIPIWWSRSAKPAALAWGCVESDTISGRARSVSNAIPSKGSRNGCRRQGRCTISLGCGGHRLLLRLLWWLRRRRLAGRRGRFRYGVGGAAGESPGRGARGFRGRRAHFEETLRITRCDGGCSSISRSSLKGALRLYYTAYIIKDSTSTSLI